MNFFPAPSRRGFLHTSAAAITSFLLPKRPLTGKPDKSYWFIHSGTCNSWPVADPVQWSLENAGHPVLERARKGLMKLSSEDGERIVRLVTRRCHLNILELGSCRVVLHHWSQQGIADLRPWFKTQGLARNDVEVVVQNRKQEVATTQHGDNYLFGDRLADNFPLQLYLNKWSRRFEGQPDDWSAAPGTWSGYAWENIENNRIPWAALKSAWRKTSSVLCLNCDQPTILTNFGNPWVGMFNRYRRFISVCGVCCRSFQDHSMKDVASWMATNLDADVWPHYRMMWDLRSAITEA